MTLPFPKNAEKSAQVGMFQKGRPSASSLTAPDETPNITQLKFPNGIQYKRAMQRCPT